MGKFPGKPSKIVNKKRVKASKCSQFQENDSVKAAENIYFGLAVFNEAFGSEQVTEFHGFSPQEARAAVVYAKKQQREVISEYEANGLHTSLKEHFEQELSRATFSVACSSQQEVIESGTHVQHCFDGGGKLNSNRDRTLPKKLTSRSPPVTPSHLKNKAAKKLLQRAKKASNYGSVASVDNSQQEKGSGAIRKFVLPSRSIHSSRVIKPNKRFIEAEEVLSDVSVSRCPSVVQLKKPRLILNPLKNPLELPESNRDVSVTNEDVLEQVKKDGVNCEKPEPLFGYNSSDGSNRSFSLHNSSHENSLIVEGKRRWKPSYKVQLKLRELNVFGAGTNRFPSKRADASSSDSTRSIHSVSDKESHSVSTDSSECGRLLAPTNSEVKSESSSYWTGSKLTSGRVILRKARLKLNTQSSPGVDGPFSVNLNSGNPSLPGTVVCGVCGAVRFYRFVKQARKFGIFSCESCRKFVSKMMKRQGSSKGGKLPVLECHKGQGTCSVPPIVRSQQWKPGRGTQFRCSYKARCPACWLKMCLRSFNMPDALRESMALMLPPEMRKDLDKLPRNKLCINFESTSSFMRSKPVEMEKLPHVSMMNTSGSRPNLYTNKTEGKGIGTNIFDFSGRVEQKPTVISLKEQSKQDKQRDLERGRPDKRQKEKHRHTNRILKKATKKLMKSKDNAKSSIERLRKKKNSGIKVRKKDGQKGDSSLPGSDVTRRQRLDLKGPRVKHVCRSASIVLGQPQATFPLDKRVEKIQVKPIQEVTKVPPKGSCCLDCTVSGSSAVKIHDIDKNFQDHSVGDAGRPTKILSASVDVESADNGDVGRPLSSAETAANSQDGEPSVSSTYRRSSKPSMQPSTTVPPQPPSVSTLPVPPMARTLPVLGKRAVPEPQDLVSIDFWESYDPEEVCNTGFGLIGSEPFHVRAMCFLCGSAGREKLIHCASCCEPYHRFCLEDGLRDTSFLADGNHGNSEEWRYNWVCQRCTVCHSCGRGLGQQLSCQRCHRTYHTECLGADRLSGRLHSPDRPWVCSSCLRCKSCGSADVTVFVGNLPHCKACFKLRQKGNYCPLCQRCYEDDDYDTKMMECGQCKCWVHAKCEGLSDEKYQVLSYLPESVEFICRMCCAIPPAPWWLAVEEELKAGYLGVLKSLSKNRKACAMLKWSPKKQCLCRPALVAKKLDFQEISDKETETDDQSDSVREDTRIAVISNKDGFLSSQQEIGSSSNITVTNNLRHLREKYNIRECSVRIENCVSKASSKLPLTKCSEMNCDVSENVTSESTKECYCLDQHTLTKPSPTLLSIKKKVNANEYSSLLQFHQEMEQLIARAQCPDLLETYHHTLKEIFPWFDPKYARVSINWKEGRPCHEETSCIPASSEQDCSFSQDQITEQINLRGNTGETEGSVYMTPKFMEGKSEEYYYSGFSVQDLRTCTLCKGVGDGLPVEEGRLLYCGQNEWVHANCALWSAEVFEEIDGSLQNVHSAVSRGRMIRCRACGKKGASVGCCARNCAETFHFPCARQIGCAFMDDKTVFCATHLTEAAGKSLHLDVEFDIRRPIYVELDRKKKKYAEPCQVKFMIGSLLIENLGEFVPASDHSDIIVPADFQCTRLYWSSVEPWRIVRYYVRTTVQAAEPQLVIDLGKNLTVDHTQEQKLVKQKLEEKVARQVMDQLLDAVCSKDVDDSCLSDPQNTADLLPPELEDEIFEDLPHDLLDGISMQDIFPKLMSCEDLTSVDVKSDMCFGSEVHKEGKEELNEDGILETEVEQVSSYEQVVKSRKDEQPISELGTHADLWFHQCSDSKEQVQEIVEDLFQNVYAKGSVQMHSARELKRSKSEVIPQPVSKKIGSSGRSHQRSCSLTWSCKLDGTLTSSSKRRKGTKTVSRSGGEGASSLVMVVDSERAHMLQELRLPDGVLVALARSGTSGMAPSVADSMRELKYRLEEDAASSEIARRRSTHQKEEGKENKCLLWHGRSQPRILQLDGAIDSGSSSSSGSEGGSPTRHVDDDLNPFPLTAACKNLHNALAGKTACDEEPVKCDRCHRTYRTRSSFERHLPTCSSDFILSTSESDSENTRSSEEEGSKRQKFPTVNHQNATSPALELENDPEKQEGITENVKSKSEYITVSSLSSHSPSSQSHPKTSQTSYRLHAVNGRPRGRQSSRTYSHRSVQKENPTAVMNMHPHLQQSQHSVPCQTHPSQQPAAPTVIMQQVPSPNMVPAFVEAFQQQTGQSLQYIATIDAHNNGYSKTPYLTAAPNSLVPGTFQLQASPESYVGLQNGGISVLPSVQLAPPQPAVIGTLIHQTPPATIQCVAAEQVVLGSTPAIEMYTDPAGGMYLTSQPMYYGLETIVSNTVMSSSQFVSAAMPGMMAASSSFSATTTQVFQASKLVEPIVDVPSSFVIMSPHTTQLPSDSGLGRPDVLACATSQLPMNVPSPVAPQPSPHIISQTQAPPVHNVPWSYPEYRSPQSYMPPSRDFQHCPPHAPQNARANTSNISQNVSCTLSMPPAAPPPTPPAKLPPPAPIPPPPLAYVPSQSQPLAQHKTNEFIQIQVPVSINANSAVHDHTSDSAAKLLKTTNHVEVPIRTINRVFPLKVNASLGGTQPVPKTNETGTDEGINNRTIHGTDGRVTIIPIPQNKTGNNNGNKQPNSLKLVFQKQAQDGYYKISNQNHQAKLVDTPKTVTASNQPVSVRAVKIKPRMVTVTEKQREGQHPSTPVKQTDIGINTKNGTTNTSHFQNGKVPPFQEKNLLGSNASPTITYEVHSQDGFTCTSSSITEVWQKVFEAVQKARELHKMPRLPQNPFSATSAGLQMLGFRHNALRYLVEQLPGVGRCIKYKPRYHKLHPPGPGEDVDALPRENPSGCARSEPFKMRSPYDMFSWLASRHRQPPKFMLSADNESTISNRRATSSNLPMAMRFRHLKETSKEAVGVYRSNIHGRGLFCLRDIEAGEMVIEYAGEVIRSMLTDKREKYYETKDIGCYMFRIDDQLVVDATMRGNAARFINHSCEPNCYSRVVDILGKKHILIFALRRIPQGEELTYDYKFPFEDVKIPCTCGSRKCRKYLN
ncbi:hypothetical protein Cfor_05481 [Coptotermes formosanus]|uniref:Histone-lysine N-methyltransferase trithorax n=1 Tax=Coptotermes formosanus TaxID=36987 RepID=A0A6L2PQ99_COPFO|nr:hypothetical protein Cfor_05481 [Coptotermes formosanus]